MEYYLDKVPVNYQVSILTCRFFDVSPQLKRRDESIAEISTNNKRMNKSKDFELELILPTFVNEYFTHEG